MRAHFILYVEDQARSRAFYGQVLDQRTVLDVPGMTEFELGVDAILGLMPEAGIRRLLPELDPGPGGPASRLRAELYLHTASPAASYARALAAGATALSPPELRAWGDVVAYCLDPDRYVIAFAARTTESG